MSKNLLAHQVYKMMAKKGIKRNADAVQLAIPETTPDKWNVAFLTTAGVHMKNQKPFDVDAGDNTVHVIPGDVSYDDLMITHTHYDTTDATKDINCVFPLEILRELKDEGVIGNVADVHFGMMGYIPDTEKLKNESIPIIIEQLKQANVDVLLASPG
nr:glycine/sarcosine/betaine reductase selenoprotein B family protein [Bacillus sp. Marseille-P3661]